MEELIESIYSNPQDWKVGRHTFYHANGFNFWVADGFFFCAPANNAMSISMIQKYRVWKAFKWWCTNAPIEANKKGDE